MATWPTTLPTPMTDGYSLEPVKAFIRTPMDAGAARQRRRFSATPTEIPIAYNLSMDQMATFEAWWHYEIDDGAGWFTVSLFNGKGYTSCEARFTEPYKALADGPLRWAISSKLEVRSMSRLTEAELAPRL